MSERFMRCGTYVRDLTRMRRARLHTDREAEECCDYLNGASYDQIEQFVWEKESEEK